MNWFSRGRPSRGRHTSRHVPVQTTPAPAEHTTPMTLPRIHPAVARARQDTVAFPAPAPEPAPFSRPYPGRRGTQHIRLIRPYTVVPSPVRDAVLVTARGSNFRWALPCACGRTHRNTNADTFRDLRISAEGAGWRQDPYDRVWRCPRCARRRDAVFGVAPVAAIEAAA